MPFTFVAQQAPVLGLSDRFPRALDGVALVVGTMAPDLAYVTRGWGYGPDGIPLWFDGHRLGNIFVLSLGALLLTVVVRRVVLPVAPLALPEAGRLHLHDYCYLSQHRHRWWVTYSSALLGALIHLGIDVFVHPDEPVVEHLSALRSTIGSIGDWQIRGWSIVELTSTVLLSILAARWVVRTGRNRSFRPTPGDTTLPSLSAVGRRVFWLLMAAGCVGAVAYACHRSQTSDSFTALDTGTAVIAFSWVMFLSAVAASLVARPFLNDDDQVEGARVVS